MDIKIGIEDLEFIEKLKQDKAYSVINYLLEYNTLKFEDIRFLRALKKPNTLFLPQELRWIIANHRFLLNLVKGRTKEANKKIGRKIFLKLCRYSDNAYSMANKLKINVKTAYRWFELFEEKDLLIINPFSYQTRTNETLMMLNIVYYPNLIKLIKILIHQQLANEVV